MKRMESKKVLAIMCFFLSVAFQASAKEKIIKSLWTDFPVKIDGSMNEWRDNTLSIEKKVKVDFAFKNNADFLFVIFRFNDVKYLSTIETTGVTLWINSRGKKKRNLGVKFTKKKHSADDYIALLEQRQSPMSEELKEQVRQRAFYIISHAETVDKKGEPLHQGTQFQSKVGSAYNVSVQQDTVTYEFRVPLKILAGTIAKSEAEPGEVVGVGFEWGGLTDEMRKEYMKGNASDAGPMGISEGGRGSGGAQGVGFNGSSPAGLTALRKMTKKYSFWTVVRLAKSREE